MGQARGHDRTPKVMNYEQVKAKAQWYQWCEEGIVAPYVYFRPENQIPNPGTRHKTDWFPWRANWKNPLDPDEIEFAEQIFHLENTAFGPQAMPIPRWVFYDCAVMPGFVCGFAMKTERLPESIRKVFKPYPNLDWTPLSLFIIIPTLKKGEWVAHNLCAVNSLLAEKDRLYGLGFLSKAFGLWYANVETCCGVTQWGNPAIKLHSHYGHMQVLTAYTPVHTHAPTMTYRSYVNPDIWGLFFQKDEDLTFLENFEPAGLQIDPQSLTSMKGFHQKILKNEKEYFLSASDVARKKLTEPLEVFQPKS